MLSLTLAQMRRSVGRLAAAGVAIAIGTAFVAATLLASGIITRTALDAVTAAYAGTDLVVTGESLTEDDAATIADVPGVALAEAPIEWYLQLQAGGTRAHLPTTPVPSDPRLLAQELVEGALPGAGEIALPTATAERLRLEVGDPVNVPISVAEQVSAASAGPDGPEVEWSERTEQLRVSGLVADPLGAFADSGGAAVVTAEDTRRWSDLSRVGDDAPFIPRILVLVESDGDLAATHAAVAEAFAGADVERLVQTRDEHAASRAADLSGETNVITGLVFAFAAVALVVASLVIANTFAVLIAQRTRQLALLRCVGATRRQLRRGVALEALLVGVSASVTGIVAGIALAQGALLVLNRTVPSVPLPELVPLAPAVLIVPLIAGTVVTVIAAMSPARAASRVAPLAAMRPAEAPSVGARGSRRRLVSSIALSVGGLVLLGLGILASASVDVLLGLAVGILGGIASITGVLAGSVFWIPRVVGVIGGWLGRRAGPASQLAAANSVRNPRRTATTSAALLIGVTLVAMMSTGAATARTSFEAEFDRAFPVDVAVQALGSPTEGGGELDPVVLDEVSAVPGVASVAALGGQTVAVAGGNEDLSLEALIVDPAAAGALVRDGELLDGFGTRTVIVPERLAGSFGIEDGQPLTVAAAGVDGAATGDGIELTARITDLDGGTLLVPSEAGARIAPDAPLTSAWVRLTDDADPVALAADLQDALSAHPVDVLAPAAQRVSFEQVVDTLLAVVVGLLGVAVVIALIGVANTLSLSVLERRRETATLRAIGLSRRQLRQMLAVEGMLIAGSGALLGTILGTFYGWAGSRTVLGPVAEGVSLSVPWRDLGAVLVVALVAGFAASVLPGRRAARTPPVAALAAE